MGGLGAIGALLQWFPPCSQAGPSRSRAPSHTVLPDVLPDQHSCGTDGQDITNAVVLPAVLRYNAPAIEAKLPAMSRALGLQQADFNTFHAAICKLLEQLAIPVTLSELGVPVEAAGRLAEKAHQDAAAGTNPRRADVVTIERLIVEAIEVGR